MSRKSAKWVSSASPTLTVGTILSILLGLAISLVGADIAISTLVGMAGISISIGVDLLLRDAYVEVFASPGWMREKIQRAGDLSYKISSSDWAEQLDSQLESEYDRFLETLAHFAQGNVY